MSEREVELHTFLQQAIAASNCSLAFAKEIEEWLRWSYWDGVTAGLKAYAWWKDGVEHVGTCGGTLKDAVKQIKPENQIPDRERYESVV
jgi:hypothetical protein